VKPPLLPDGRRNPVSVGHDSTTGSAGVSRVCSAGVMFGEGLPAPGQALEERSRRPPFAVSLTE